MIVYGSMQCVDCVECREAYDAEQMNYRFRNIDKNLVFLKEFLALRDRDSAFDTVKQKGAIGIPRISNADDSVTLYWESQLP